MSRAFRITLNAALIWVAGSTFWYSCIIKQACLPEPPPQGISWSLPLDALPMPGSAPARSPVNGTPDKPLSFVWNISEPVRGPGFDRFRRELLAQRTPGATLEITGIHFAGERGSELGLSRARRVQELFADRVPADRVKIAARSGERASAEQRALFEAVTIRWVEPGKPAAPVTQAAAAPQAAPIAGTQQAAVGKVLVYFPTGAGTQTLDPALLAQLRALATEAQRNGSTVVITGHTDNRGDEAGNIALGMTRATSIRDYLTATVQPPPEMRVESEGPRQPLASNDTDEGRARNRRVEVTVQ